jgi:hypothetical protein
VALYILASASFLSENEAQILEARDKEKDS